MEHQLTTSQKKLSASSTNSVLATASNKYGLAFVSDFLPKYPTKNRGLAVKSLMDAVIQDSPCLAALDNKYPNNPSLFWLKYQLIEVFTYCGVYKTLSEYQIKRTAELIRHEYYWLTVTELMEFFNKFEAGRYKKIYGYNPQDLLQSLNLFSSDVQKARAENERRLEAKRQKEISSQPSISYEEYCKKKGKKPIDKNSLIKKV